MLKCKRLGGPSAGREGRMFDSHAVKASFRHPRLVSFKIHLDCRRTPTVDKSPTSQDTSAVPKPQHVEMEFAIRGLMYIRTNHDYTPKMTRWKK